MLLTRGMPRLCLSLGVLLAPLASLAEEGAPVEPAFTGSAEAGTGWTA